MKSSVTTLLFAIPIFSAIAGAYVYLASDYFGSGSSTVRSLDEDIARGESLGKDTCVDHMSALAASVSLIKDIKTAEDRKHAMHIACAM